MSAPVLDVRNLSIQFRTDTGLIQAVDDVSFQVLPGQTLGIVGESGSGKSVSCLAAMGLIPTPPGHIQKGAIWFQDPNHQQSVNLLDLSPKQLQRYRGGCLAMIFQEPMSSLNPVYSCGFQIIEAIRQHQTVSEAEAKRQALALLQEVKLLPSDRELQAQYAGGQHAGGQHAEGQSGRGQSDDRLTQQQINQHKQNLLKRYPHELSGGQMQRVMIAMALSCNPSVLIADEPTTALDVTVQATILELLRELGQKRNMAVIFVSHDLGVIAEIADHVTVMYKGKVVESGPVDTIFNQPQAPYTQGLLACRPRLDQELDYLPTISDFLAGKVIYQPPNQSGLPEQSALPEQSETPSPEQSTDDPLAPSSSPTADQSTPLTQTTVTTTPEAATSRDSHPTPPSTKAESPGSSSPEPVEPIPQYLLQVQNLQVAFPIKGALGQTRRFVTAVDDVSFTVKFGETLGLVGESGCGKTTLARTLLRLIKPRSGQIIFQGRNITHLPQGQLRRLRRGMQIIFQNPDSALNPRMTVGAAITEPMQIHHLSQRPQSHRQQALELLAQVKLEADALNRYPHEFSGGQRQRICIARALALKPSFVICDESVSALDVSVQAEVLNLLKELQQRLGLTYIFISHDLSVVKFMSDRIMVMNKGKVEEIAPAAQIYTNPKRDYTRKLIAAIPQGKIT